MASIKKRPDGRWRARYRDDSGKEHARHFGRKVDAQGWLDRETAGLVRGDWIDPRHGEITFSKWFAEWSGRQVWTDGTLEAAQQAANSATFGDIPIRKILRSHVEAWVKVMSTTLAASTTRMRYNYVHMAFRAAMRDKIIREAPSDGVALPKVARAGTTMLIPTPVQVAAARDDCSDPTFVGFVGVCAYAGLRLGEAAGLQAGDVDFLRREVRVRRQVQGQTRSGTKVVSPKAGSARTCTPRTSSSSYFPGTSATSDRGARMGGCSGPAPYSTGTLPGTCGARPASGSVWTPSPSMTCGTSTPAASSPQGATS